MHGNNTCSRRFEGFVTFVFLRTAQLWVLGFTLCFISIFFGHSEVCGDSYKKGRGSLSEKHAVSHASLRAGVLSKCSVVIARRLAKRHVTARFESRLRWKSCKKASHGYPIPLE